MNRRILIIGGGSASVGAALASLGLNSVTTAEEFRELVGAIPYEPHTPVAHLKNQPVPKFGGGRSYLKRKKGRS